LCLFGCACDGCLVVGAGGRPPEDEGGGGSEDRDSESSSGVYVTPLQSPADSASSTPDQTPTDMFLLPLGPGQWPDQLDAHQLLTPVSFCYFGCLFNGNAVRSCSCSPMTKKKNVFPKKKNYTDHSLASIRRSVWYCFIMFACGTILTEELLQKLIRNVT
jgi:hypothetical protein